MNITFAKTQGPLCAGHKTCTRRDWKPSYMLIWQKAWDEGRFTHNAYNKSPRVGGQQMGTITMTCRPYWEPLRDMPESDLEAEGGLWGSVEEFAQLFGGDMNKPLAVVRFEYVEGSHELDDDANYCKLGPLTHEANGGQRPHLFCPHCPSEVPEGCEQYANKCNPGVSAGGCPLVDECPCFVPADEERLATYDTWLARRNHNAQVWQRRDKPIARRRMNSAAEQRERAARRADAARAG